MEIKNREVVDLRGANLRGATLPGADLVGTDLSNTDMAGADLTRSNLTGANLSNADLTDAIMSGTNLTNANLTGANLTRSNLAGANLSNADLTGAALKRANLTGVDLAVANLASIREDFQREVSKLPDELPFLRAALVEGRIDGAFYGGVCCCLAGTLAKSYGSAVNSCFVFEGPPLKNDYHVDSWSPRERWFMAIRPGDTPDNNQLVRITLGWLDEVMAQA